MPRFTVPVSTRTMNLTVLLGSSAMSEGGVAGSTPLTESGLKAWVGSGVVERYT